MNEREQLCKEFTLLTGGQWQEITFNDIQTVSEKAGISLIEAKAALRAEYNNPTYENPADILKVMMARKDWDDFSNVISCGEYIDPSYHCIGIEYIVEEDKLLKTAVEFLIERKK